MKHLTGIASISFLRAVDPYGLFVALCLIALIGMLLALKPTRHDMLLCLSIILFVAIIVMGWPGAT